MFIKKPDAIKSSEITDEKDYLNRRQFIKETTLLSAGVMAGSLIGCEANSITDEIRPGYAEPSLLALKKLPYKTNKDYSVKIKPNTFSEITSYNNFYEFSTDKKKVKERAKDFKTRPWTIEIEGHVKRAKAFDIDDLIKKFPLEERIYRFRCVEAWAMVVPWVGIPLASLIKYVEPTSRAKYVEFITLYDPTQMPGTKDSQIDWPYREALRLDEASHPLALLGVGLYGRVLPNQNGAPVRLIVPWKYGFKNIKSIVKIRFLDSQPQTTWNALYPKEYGFYANINPNVPHPRWSQAKEQRLGETFKRKTLLFNGYGKEVANLYKGMDLTKYY